MSESNNEDFPEEYRKLKNDILKYLGESNLKEAFVLIRSFFSYPNEISDELLLKDAFILLESIIRDLIGDHLGEIVKKLIDNPDSISDLYSLAYELYELKIHDMAAFFLGGVNKIKPQDPNIVSELVSNLEAMMLNKEAYNILSESRELVESDELHRYLLAFNGLMIGKIEEPLKHLPTLRNSDDTDIQFMYQALKGMLNRASALKESRALDDRDLRGWHMVLNGVILLHYSPFGLEDGMFGRYAYISDSPTLIQEGITRVKEVLDSSGLEIPSVLALPDRSSQILAMIASKLLNLPLKQWNDIDANTPGLIVAYDLDEVYSESVLIEIAEHRPNQILWVHASCWTNPFPFSPDITTYLYQENVNPWSGGSLAYDTKKEKVTITDPDKSDNEEIATRFLEPSKDVDYINDLEDLLSLIEPLKTLENEDLPGIFREKGRRIRQRQGSPVLSNRF